MKFAAFYPFNEKEVQDASLLARKRGIDAVFAKLNAFEDDMATLSKEAAKILQECEKVLDTEFEVLRKAASGDVRDMSAVIIAAVSAAMMEIRDRINYDIRREYPKFVRNISQSAEVMVRRMMREDLRSEHASISALDSTLKYTEILSDKRMPRALTLKEGTALSDVNVPDILANACLVTGDTNLTKIRKIFFDLWQIEELRPFLTIMAYATQGYFIDGDGKITHDEERKLKLILVDGSFALPGAANPSDSHGGGISFNNIMYISTGSHNLVRSDLEIAGMITHELYHYLQKLLYDLDHLSLPTPYKTGECDVNKRRVLDAMKHEASLVKDMIPTSLKPSAYDYTDFVIYKIPVPNKPFTSVADYSVGCVQDVEIVARTPETLVYLDSLGYDSRHSLAFLENEYGLRACVDYFREEQIKLRHLCATLERESDLRFADSGDRFCDVPPYSVAQSTAFHIAIAKAATTDDYVDLRALVIHIKEEAAKQRCAMIHTKTGNDLILRADDSREPVLRSALRHAIDYNKPELLFEFDPLLSFVTPISTIFPVLIHLFDVIGSAQSPIKEQAIEVFRNANLAAERGDKIDAPFSKTKNIFRALAKLRKADLPNQELLAKLQTTDPAEIDAILRNIRDGQFTELRDDLGFSFFDYFAIAASEELSAKVRKEFYPSKADSTFYPNDPLRDKLGCLKADEFLSEMKRQQESDTFNPQKPMGLSIENNSLVEEVALSVNYTKDEERRKWFNILVNIIVVYKINPGERINDRSTKTIAEIIPPELSPELELHRRKPGTFVAEHTEEQCLSKNSACTIL